MTAIIDLVPKAKIRIPASAAVLKGLIPTILQSHGPLKRIEINSRLRQILPAKGFVPNTNSALKKALSQLLTERLIESPRTSWYQAPDARAENSEKAEVETFIAEELPAMQPEASKLRIGRVIGEGPESVYVYFHDVYSEVAQGKGRSTWECKVGWTIGDPDARVLGQGALTCFPRCPLIGLVIRTHDGRNLERLLHAALSYAGVRLPSGGGSEWFITSPELVEQWFTQFEETLKTLKCENAAAL